MSEVHATSQRASTWPSTPHDSGHVSLEPVDAFHRLVHDINTILGSSNGIDSAGVEVEKLVSLMQGYESKENEWSKYAFRDSSRPYTRNLVDKGNGKSNLLILVWTPGRASPIHDHANAHCVMKILKGSLTETVYGWPCQRSSHPSSCAAAHSSPHPSAEHNCNVSREGLESGALCERRTTTYEKGAVTYMSDRLGLHRIRNPSEDEVAVSLHLYTPPNAARHGCHIFDAVTGKKSHVRQCYFYSELGVKMQGRVHDS